MADPVNTPASGDVRPVVRTSSGIDFAPWIFGAVVLAAGLWVFFGLSASRLDDRAPATAVPQDYGSGRIASPDGIDMPDRFTLEPRSPERLAEQARPVELRALPQAPQPYFEPPSAPPRIVDYPTPPAPPPQPYVATFGGAPAAQADSAEADDESGERVEAGRLANPSMTVPLGTIIPAVLETAFDSTRPGGVRALVQRNVMSFDGSRVLIPRGSRLYGEYDADLKRGQNRALIRWTRLLRPDGVTIALDSAASDPLGRAGVRGKVDSKFFQRFGNAILGSALDIGVGLATREVGGGTVVALPGSTQNIGGQRGEEIQPTLKVKHGTSVSVYVARDLDFSSVEK